MTITVEATFENGILKPKTPLNLAEGARVQVTIRPHAEANGAPGKTSAPEVAEEEDIELDKDDPLAKVIGSCESGLTDGADNHDYYIYGKPRK